MKKLEDYKSGNYINVDDYKSFIPSEINEDWVWNDSELNTLLSKASLELGNLNGYASQIPNIDIYIQMHVKVEANKSSRIEGTRTTIDEDLSDVLDINPEKRDDWQEVKNYVEAVNYGFKRIIPNAELSHRTGAGCDDFPVRTGACDADQKGASVQPGQAGQGRCGDCPPGK